MELRFVQPDLRRLDLLVSEVIAAPVSLGQRPPRSTAGLLDYRLAGKASEIIRSGALTGQLGEKVFLKGRPRLPFDKILLYGSGDPASFNPQIYGGLVDMLLETLSQMGVRRAVVELPGRATDLISPELAAEILLERAGNNPLFDTWTLVDTPKAQRTVASRLRSDRRSQWRISS